MSRGFAARKTTAQACGLALALVLALNGTPVRADLMRFDFGGVITSADPGFGIAPGERFSGSFAYDPAAPHTGITYEGFHQNLFGKAIWWPSATPDASGISLEVGGKPVIADQGGLGVLMTGDEPAIGYPRGTGTGVSISNAGVDASALGISLNLSNPDRDVYPSLSLPSSLLLADFPSASLSVIMGRPASAGFRGSLDTLTQILPAPAPEPSTAALVIAGLGWLAIARRKGGRGRSRDARDRRDPMSQGS